MYKLLTAMALAFLLIACEKEKTPAPDPVQKSFPLTGFTRAHAGETYNLTVKQGTTFSVVAKGRSEDLADLLLSIEQGYILSIRYNGFKPDRYRVDIAITLPILTGIHLTGAAIGTVNGFGQQASAVKVVLAGVARCSFTQLPVLVDAFLSANSVLALSGTASDLLASLLGSARLDAYDASVADADIYTAAKATAQVRVQNSLAAFASGDSRIYYKGNPASLSIEESETGKVVRE